jgi:hypothetical protein
VFIIIVIYSTGEEGKAFVHANYHTIPLRYQKELEKCTEWQSEKRIKGIDESVMMIYFKNIGAASEWSWYSMLKSTLFVFQNVDIAR